MNLQKIIVKVTGNLNVINCAQRFAGLFSCDLKTKNYDNRKKLLRS